MIKRYIARIYIPIVFDLYAETKEQAIQIATKEYKRLKQKDKVAACPASWVGPEIEIEE